VVWDVGPTRTSVDFAAHLKKVAEHFPDMRGFDWVLDNEYALEPGGLRSGGEPE
jgi:hypothetical protein